MMLKKLPQNRFADFGKIVIADFNPDSDGDPIIGMASPLLPDFLINIWASGARGR